MAALREIVEVGEDGELRLCAFVGKGRFRVEIVPVSDDTELRQPQTLRFPDLRYAGWPLDARFSREEIYGEDDETCSD